MIVRARFRELEASIEPMTATSVEARLLALAYRVERDVEGGIYRSVAEVAAVLGLSRARLSQLMRRRWAAVAKQEGVLGGQLPGGRS